jgi:hypothetical protein
MAVGVVDEATGRSGTTSQGKKTTCVKTNPDHGKKIAACYTWSSFFGGCPTYGRCNPCISDCKVTGYTYKIPCTVFECV